MNNQNQLGSNQSSHEARVRVCCTRPRLPGEGAHPHFNAILEADILDKSKHERFSCSICGMPLKLGAGGRYVPIERLGSGGFGVTFTAVDLVTPGNKPVLDRPKRVIKQLCPVQQLPPVLLQKVQEKFRGEAEVLADLHHPNIPILYDFFEEEASDSRYSNTNNNFEVEEPRQRFFYLVQQYVDGIDLDKALKQQGAFSEQEVITFLKSLLKILDDIHSGNHHSSKASIIHRDIKPANIICSTKEAIRKDGSTDRVVDLSEGKFHLIDFGAVKEVVQVVEQQVPSQASAIISYGFSPPEQMARKPVGFFSDIYALGATCINLLTAKNPDDLSVPFDLSMWKKHTEVSSKFAAILDRMLAPQPEARYQTAGEVLQDLKLLQLLPPPIPKLPIIAAVLGLLVLAVVVGSETIQNLFGNNGFSSDPPEPPLPAPALISAGDKPIEDSAISLTGEYEELRQQGIKSFANGNYETARNTFAQIRRRAEEEWANLGANLDTPYGRALQDPTILIYQNNAEVRLRHQNRQQIYRIAAPVPLNLNIGKEMLWGIAQAQDQAVNPPSGEQSINLEIVIANDLNNPNQAKAVAKSLTDNTFDGQQILAVLGHYLSDNTCVTLKNYYVPANIPVVSPLSTAANIRRDCDREEDSLFFRITSSTQIEANTLVKYLTTQIPRPRVAIFYNSDDAFSLNLFNQFQSTLNANEGTVVATVDLFNERDVEAKLNDVNNRIDALAVLPDGRAKTVEPFQRAIEVIKASGGEKPILGSVPLYTNEAAMQLAGQPNLKNQLILTTDWYQDCAPNFLKQAEKYWFGSVNRNTAQSYEAVQAVQATLTEGVTRDQIRQKLTEIQIQSDVFPNKTISFDTDGNRQELAERILTTLGDDTKKPFVLVEGQGCPAN